MIYPQSEEKLTPFSPNVFQALESWGEFSLPELLFLKVTVCLP